MPVCLALPICALLILAALPVRIGFQKAPGVPLRLGASVGPVRRQGTLAPVIRNGRPALRLAAGRGELVLTIRRPKSSLAVKPLRRALFFLAKRFRTDQMAIAVNVDAGDARATVLLTALLAGALETLGAIRPGLPLKRRVTCSFTGAGSLRLVGIFSTRVGNIMLAALLFCRDYCFGRLRKWTGIPSKTS